jgi:hypothetical protein
MNIITLHHVHNEYMPWDKLPLTEKSIIKEYNSYTKGKSYFTTTDHFLKVKCGKANEHWNYALYLHKIIGEK